ncbi:MAG: hypothetical protein ACYC7F_11020 [Gemmatimonadaceae bacterium]
MRTVMLALFIALLLLVLGGLYLAFPAGVDSVRFVAVLALGILGVIAYIIYEKVREIIKWQHYVIDRCIATIQGWRDPTQPAPSGQPPGI